MNLLENIQKTKLDLKYFERNTAPQKTYIEITEKEEIEKLKMKIFSKKLHIITE